MALTKVNNRLIDGAYINVLDYMSDAQTADVLSATGGTVDVTAAVQAAVDASWNSDNAHNNPVFFPAGRYLITSTINIHAGTKLRGVNIDAGGVSGAQSFPNRISDSKGTLIIFNPSTQQSLFVPVLPKGGSNAWGAIGIEGFNIWGNTSKSDYNRSILGETGTVVETSLYAIDFADVQTSSVRNVGIMGFMSGIRERDRCQNNNYENIYIQFCREAAILFSASTTGVEITDSRFSNVRAWACKHGVEIEAHATADPLQIRFHGCFFASMDSHAFIIASGSREISFIDCYSEGNGLDTSIADTATFYISGLASAGDIPVLNVIGGQYAGGTGGISPTNNSFLETDDCGGVNLIAVSAKRYVTGIICTANTRDKSIYLANPFFESVTGSLFDASTANKIIGTFRTVRSDGGSNVVQVRSDYFVAESVVNVSAPSIRLGDGSSSNAYPGADDTMDLGTAAIRWAEVFAANGTINTSDEREKQQVRSLSDTEKAVAVKCKDLLKAYKWNKAVDEKGDDARIHFGIVAQELKAAFESEGLDAHKYGMFCYDQWDDVLGSSDEVLAESGNRYGVRYEQLLAFIISAL
jgi:hypothetical protein